MRLNTASEAISFLRGLEARSVDFYVALSQHYEDKKELFLDFAKESKKNIANIERTYFGVISDALEACFAFDLDPSAYEIQDYLPKGNLKEDIAAALQMEAQIVKFYQDAAAQSRGLMADVPRVMERIAKNRQNRIAKIGEITAKVRIDILKIANKTGGKP